MKTQKQCKTFPWRVECQPEKDIPNGYSCDLHENLRDTIAEGIDSLSSLRAMACHYSPVGKEVVCVGWLHNQIGAGNNIGARLAVMSGRMPVPEVVGEQHERFDDTLPKGTMIMDPKPEQPNEATILIAELRRQATANTFVMPQDTYRVLLDAAGCLERLQSQNHQLQKRFEELSKQWTPTTR